MNSGNSKRTRRLLRLHNADNVVSRKGKLGIMRILGVADGVLLEEGDVVGGYGVVGVPVAWVFDRIVLVVV